MLDFDEEKQNKQLDDLRVDEEEELVSMLADTKYSLPYVNLYKLGIDNEALRLVSEEDAHRLFIAPFKLVGKNIYIALRSPTEELKSFLIEETERRSLIPVFYMASLNSIKKVWERYRELSLAEKSKIGGIDISKEVLTETAKSIKRMKDIKNSLKNEMEHGKKHKITRLLEIILAGAIAIKASDVHIEPEEDRARLRLRLDGVLQDVEFFTPNTFHLLNSRIKLLSGMKLTSNNAQDGRFSITEGTSEISIRTSLIPGSYGEAIVMRILDPKSIQINLEQLEIEQNLFTIIKEEIEKPNGLILLTGPTGSGKTTTLYAFLRKIYNPEINIITIEDPVEYRLEGITQTQVEDDKGYGFLEGLRAALRQDPDVIMVGEIRDKETAQLAIQAALTGHLVLSTLHTNNSIGAIPRLIDMGIDPYLIAPTLILTVAQRLAHLTCPSSRKLVPIDPSIKMQIEDELKDLPPEFRNKIEIKDEMYETVPSSECAFGTRGRIAIFEVLKINKEVENIILKNPTYNEIYKVARKNGMLTMKEDAMLKAIKGVIPYTDVYSFTNEGD